MYIRKLFTKLNFWKIGLASVNCVVFLVIRACEVTYTPTVPVIQGPQDHKNTSQVQGE